MRGRRPQPTILKLLKGNPGRRPLNSREPQPPKPSGRCPAWLTGYGKEAWTDFHKLLTDMSILTAADEFALALLCSAVEEFRHAREVTQKKGRTYVLLTKSGERMVRIRPEVGIAVGASARILKFMVEFGLTPASRAKVKVVEGVQTDPLDAYLQKGKPT